MMKAILLFSTMLLNALSEDLPKLNSPDPANGKSIKAHPIDLHKFCPGDTTDILVVPEFHFAGGSGGYHIRTVVIDPGHGGHDPGCLGEHSREKHLALAIGKFLAEGLKQTHPDLKVIMTRSEDVFVPLHERAAIATRNKADLFISIHCNAFSQPSAKGVETYVLGLHATEANLAVAKRENEAILYEDNYQENYGYDPNSPEAHILFSMFQNAFLDQSIAFAEKVQGHASSTANRVDRGVKQAGFLVLRHATMPSVLVETGYLTNRSEEAFLANEEGQKDMANAILLAFGDYKKEMEGNADQVAVKPLPEKKTEVKPSPKPPVTQSTDGQAVVVKQETASLPAKPKPKKKMTLDISPSPTETPPPAEVKTNTSPTKPAKISATQPVAPPAKENEKPVDKPAEKPATTPTATPEAAAIFCVQLAASPKLMDVSAGKWARIDQTVEVVEEGSLYKYQVRNIANLETASQVMAQLRSQGFSDAFVVAYKYGKRVDPRTLK